MTESGIDSVPSISKLPLDEMEPSIWLVRESGEEGAPAPIRLFFANPNGEAPVTETIQTWFFRNGYAAEDFQTATWREQRTERFHERLGEWFECPTTTVLLKNPDDDTPYPTLQEILWVLMGQHGYCLQRKQCGIENPDANDYSHVTIGEGEGAREVQYDLEKMEKIIHEEKTDYTDFDAHEKETGEEDYSRIKCGHPLLRSFCFWALPFEKLRGGCKPFFVHGTVIALQEMHYGLLDKKTRIIQYANLMAYVESAPDLEGGTPILENLKQERDSITDASYLDFFVVCASSFKREQSSLGRGWEPVFSGGGTSEASMAHLTTVMGTRNAIFKMLSAQLLRRTLESPQGLEKLPAPVSGAPVAFFKKESVSQAGSSGTVSGAAASAAEEKLGSPGSKRH